MNSEYSESDNIKEFNSAGSNSWFVLKAYVYSTIIINLEVSFDPESSFIFSGDFKIDSTNGDIKVKETLDRERKNSYNLVINAKDGGVPSLSSNTTINVHILDVNDVKPVFQPFNLSAIPEVNF